ncbi:DUF6907 domain-containing protein (plasmid) [Nocardia sp. CA-084685]|uniref:DUF6907 domain-containing protein n=1 Tax=Nocardia sp. CA-084685 TaxID=3239970 RepID=UPI003D956B50
MGEWSGAQQSTAGDDANLERNCPPWCDRHLDPDEPDAGHTHYSPKIDLPVFGTVSSGGSTLELVAEDPADGSARQHEIMFTQGQVASVVWTLDEASSFVESMAKLIDQARQQ